MTYIPGNRGFALNHKKVTGTYTVKDTDTVIACNGTFTVTLPKILDTDGNGPPPGQCFVIMNVGAGTITVARGQVGDTIRGATSLTLTTRTAAWLISDGVSDWN